MLGMYEIGDFDFESYTIEELKEDFELFESEVVRDCQEIERNSILTESGRNRKMQEVLGTALPAIGFYLALAGQLDGANPEVREMMDHLRATHNELWKSQMHSF